MTIEWGILANGLVGNFTMSLFIRIQSCPTRPSGSVLVAPLQMLTANHDLGDRVMQLFKQHEHLSFDGLVGNRASPAT